VSEDPVSDDVPGGAGPPADPKATRFHGLSSALEAAVALAGVLAVLALVLPGTWSRAAGIGLVVLLVVAPLLRVAWFAQRWFRRGDPRYGLVALGVLVIVAVGALLA